MHSCGLPHRVSPRIRAAPVAEPVRWPSEKITLETVRGEVRVLRPGLNGVPALDSYRFTGWDSARGPRRFPPAKPSGRGSSS